MCDLFFVSVISVSALIRQKPSSVIIEEEENVNLVCKATGLPVPTVSWRKAFVGHLPRGKTTVIDGNMTIFSVTKEDMGAYLCSAKNLLGEDSSIAVVTVIDRLKFTITPPKKAVALESSSLILNCKAQGSIEITWKRANKNLPQNHVTFPNGTFFLTKVTTNDAGSYTCVAKNYQRTIKASCAVEVHKAVSCSSIKTGQSRSLSGNYVIDPDGKGGVAPFSVYCDMSDKGGVGVTIISHDSESRIHVANITGCNYNNPGCYSKNVTYTGVNVAQLAALTRVSQNCEQFIKFECNNGVTFVPESAAWWVSRDGRKMNYWGGAGGSANTCACGVTNSCLNGQKCNCYNGGSGWREDSGLLTDKSVLPVSQIRLADFDDPSEEGYHTLGKLKCYGQA